MSARVLIVDDEVGMQVALREVLSRKGYDLKVAADGLAAMVLMENESFDLVLTDVRMPEISGIELLDRVQARWPETRVVVMTAYGAIEDAVEAMKKGAADYLLKPFSSETIEGIVQRLLAQRGESPGGDLDPEESGGNGASRGNGADPISVSAGMRQALELSQKVADSVATILIQGESGTGKEVVARYIHQQSGRRNHPFVAVNCAALPEGLLESELFGHEKGAFTGAVLSRKGKFELANRGTLLLDEISEMPLALQAKLLRVLQEREIDPIGAQRSVPLDVRVIATTNRDLAAYVREGKFREDLFYRIQVITIFLPPLRERREDILPLGEYFVRRHCRVNRRSRKRLTPAMREYLVAQNWRGNVRELENFLERAVLLCQSDEITLDNIFLGAHPCSPLSSDSRPPLVSEAAVCLPSAGYAVNSLPDDSEGYTLPAGFVTLEEMERKLILRTLGQVGGNRTRAADLLGVSVRTIRNKLNQYGMGGNGGESAKTESAITASA